MKKTMAWLLLAAVLLSACGTAQQETPSPVQTPVPGGVTAETSTPETVEWNGEGRPYRQQALPSRADSTVSLFAAGDDYYSAIMYFAEDGRQAFELLKNGEELIYAPADTYITCPILLSNSLKVSGLLSFAASRRKPYSTSDCFLALSPLYIALICGKVI